MTAFITPDALRLSLKNSSAADAAALDQACTVACGVIENGWREADGTWCPGVGPVLFAANKVEKPYASGPMVSVSGMVRTLTAISAWPSGTAYTPADFTIDGRDILRTDGQRIGSARVQVTYDAGFVAADEAAPEWAVDAALAVAEQLFRRRFKLGDQTGPLGFLVPAMTRSLIAPYQPVSLGFA